MQMQRKDIEWPIGAHMALMSVSDGGGGGG